MIPTAFLAQATAPTTTTTATISASSSTPATKPAEAPPWYANPMVLPFVLIAVFFIFMSRNKKKQEKQAQDLRNSLKKGDRVQTIGGILGTVYEARENEVVLKVDETNNTKLRFTRNAIHRVIVDDAAADKK